MQLLKLAVLTRENFSPYCDVIELGQTDPVAINSGNCLRYHDLAIADVCRMCLPPSAEWTLFNTGEHQAAFTGFVSPIVTWYFTIVSYFRRS